MRYYIAILGILNLLVSSQLPFFKRFLPCVIIHPSWTEMKPMHCSGLCSSRFRAGIMTGHLGRLEVDQMKYIRRCFQQLGTCDMQQGRGSNLPLPRLHLPHKAMEGFEAAKAVNAAPDAFYARRLLDATGIVIVPVSGFGRVPGTWHISCTFLPQEDKVPAIVSWPKAFHETFMEEFCD